MTVRQLRHSARDTTNAGFTLVELLVVLGILALIAGIATPQVFKYLGTARVQTAQTQISSIASAIDLYGVDTGALPDMTTGLKSLITAPAGVKGWNGPYLRTEQALVDPWGRPYIYRIPGKSSSFEVMSFGKDGVDGGDGENRDVVSR